MFGANQNGQLTPQLRARYLALIRENIHSQRGLYRVMSEKLYLHLPRREKADLKFLQSITSDRKEVLLQEQAPQNGFPNTEECSKYRLWPFLRADPRCMRHIPDSWTTPKKADRKYMISIMFAFKKNFMLRYKQEAEAMRTAAREARRNRADRCAHVSDRWLTLLANANFREEGQPRQTGNILGQRRAPRQRTDEEEEARRQRARRDIHPTVRPQDCQEDEVPNLLPVIPEMADYDSNDGQEQYNGLFAQQQPQPAERPAPQQPSPPRGPVMSRQSGLTDAFGKQNIKSKSGKQSSNKSVHYEEDRPVQKFQGANKGVSLRKRIEENMSKLQEGIKESNVKMKGSSDEFEESKLPDEPASNTGTTPKQRGASNRYGSESASSAMHFEEKAKSTTFQKIGEHAALQRAGWVDSPQQKAGAQSVGGMQPMKSYLGILKQSENQPAAGRPTLQVGDPLFQDITKKYSNRPKRHAKPTKEQILQNKNQFGR